MRSTRPFLARFQFLGIIVLTAILIVAMGIGLQFFFSSAPISQAPAPISQAPAPSAPISQAPAPSAPLAPPLLPPRPKIIPSSPPAPILVPTPNPKPLEDISVVAPVDPVTPVAPVTTAPKTYLGHYAYAEQEPNRLVQVGMYYDRPEFLDQEAAAAFGRMQKEALAQGVELRIISGFRSIAAQEKLFQRQIQRQGSPELAARLSAPPGYSEHHTGYALDIGDGQQTNTDLKYDFATTAAYQWLIAQAHLYGFELSFPPNNAQGVNFEPWHWRYRGSEQAKAIFAAAP